METNNELELKKRELQLYMARELLKRLTDDERMDLFGDYCKHCGDTNPNCHCWNDE